MARKIFLGGGVLPEFSKRPRAGRMLGARGRERAQPFDKIHDGARGELYPPAGFDRSPPLTFPMGAPALLLSIEFFDGALPAAH